MANEILRPVQDKDFAEIAKLYADYIEWQKTVEPRGVNKKLSSKQMKDIFHKKKMGEQAKNYDTPELAKLAPDHYGFVAERSGKVIAYYEWGGRLYREEKQCGCYISVWKQGETKVADKLLAYCFEELKKIGFQLATGHMSRRMRARKQHSFFKKYATRITVEDDGESQLFQRDL